MIVWGFLEQPLCTHSDNLRISSVHTCVVSGNHEKEIISDAQFTIAR